MAAERRVTGGTDGEEPRRRSVLGLVLVFLVILTAVGSFLGYLFIPAVRDLAARLPVVGRFVTPIEEPADPLVAQRLQLEQERIRLAQWETDLAAREAQVAAREQQLASDEARVEQLLAENEALQTKLVGELDSLTRQARIYSQMKAAEAARILSEFSDAYVASVLNLMKDDLAAKILVNFEEFRSARILSLMGNQGS
ncbi:MAG: hypothetical protein AB1331_00425 [Bacillota bacterium]